MLSGTGGQEKNLDASFFAFTFYFFAPIFSPTATPVFHVCSHDGRLDSVAAIGFGLGDAAATFPQGNGAVMGKGV